MQPCINAIMGLNARCSREDRNPTKHQKQKG